MIISLIGMSGIGKSYWSSKLRQEKGFISYCCDDLVEEKLKPELKILGLKGIHDVSRWMGEPYEKEYELRAHKYLFFERQVMFEIFDELQNIKPDNHPNVVIDTTGSIIYTGEDILAELREISLILYLDITDQIKKQMYELYIKEPKPVFWGDSFTIKNGENPRAALARCYPDLLNYRINIYRKYADVILDYHEVRKDYFTTDYLIQMLKQKQQASP